MNERDILIEILKEISWERFRSRGYMPDAEGMKNRSEIQLSIRCTSEVYKRIVFDSSSYDKISDLKNLEHLSLQSNWITHLPDKIGLLTNLKTLDLSNNLLRRIPTSIGNLVNLERLDIRNNELIEVPDELFVLKKLTSLDLSNNILSSIPEDIGELSNLLELNLQNNLLTVLPENLGKLTKLKKLDLSYHHQPANLHLVDDQFYIPIPKGLSKIKDLWISYGAKGSSDKIMLIGLALMKSDVGRAKKIFKKVLELDPDNNKVRDLLLELKI